MNEEEIGNTSVNTAVAEKRYAPSTQSKMAWAVWLFSVRENGKRSMQFEAAYHQGRLEPLILPKPITMGNG